VRARLTRAIPIALWLTLTVLGGEREAVAASNGGCAIVRGGVARAICSDPKLNRLNWEMRRLYQRALLTGDRRSLVAEQWNWIVERNRACAKKQGVDVGACIALSLTQRILEFRTVLERVPQASGKLAIVPTQVPHATASKQNTDCLNAGGAVDRAICNDATLSHWEERLGKLYQQALDDPSFREILVNDQQRWIRERNDTCGPSLPQMTDCVLQMTKRRIEQFVQFINSRDDPQDRRLRVGEILSGKIVPPPGLDADSIDRESARADQSELILADARICIRKNFNTGNAEVSDEKQLVALVSAPCFTDFSNRLSALELGALAKPSFEMLVHQELSASK
jgi:uncharacterized protein